MDCIFCKIGEGKIPANKVYEDENVLAFHDINKKAPIHILIIPKKHIASFQDLSDADDAIVLDIHRGIRNIATKLNIDKDGYRIITNIGEFGRQEVKHLHFHLLSGEKLNDNLN